MLRLAISIISVLITTTAGADEHIATVHDTIDATVWKPFQEAFEAMDGEALNAVYADEVLRVTPEGLDTAGAFKQFNMIRFDASRTRGDRINLDFWFDSRQTNASTSYDVGFYRFSTTTPTGATSYFYGQFHIVLKKLDGQWKIIQDWDTATIGGKPITAEDFARSSAIKF